MVKILYKSQGAVVILKPVGLSSVPDEDSTTDALTETAEELSALGERAELYPIHRLDKVVSGLLVFARTKTYATELSKLVSGEGIGKEYFAVVEGACPAGELTDYLCKSKVQGKALVGRKGDKDAKLAILHSLPIATVKTDMGERTLVKIVLKTGRFHQIRAQLSSRGCPIVGDKKYGSKDFLCRTPALFSHKIETSLFSEQIYACALPELSEYPWSLFAEKLYENQE